ESEAERRARDDDPVDARDAGREALGEDRARVRIAIEPLPGEPQSGTRQRYRDAARVSDRERPLPRIAADHVQSCLRRDHWIVPPGGFTGVGAARRTRP